MMYRLSGIIIIVVLLAYSATSSQATDRTDFIISQDYAASEQNNPSVAVGLGGRFAVVWTDYRNGNGDVYARLYDSGATAVGDEFVLNDDGIAAWQLEPGLSSDWYGNYYAVWKDYRNQGYPFGPDIYYQKLDSTGPLGDNLNITVELPDSSHQSPSVGATGWGKTVVAWADLRNRNWDVYAQSLTDGGQAIGVNQRVNDDVSLTPQHEPAIALSPAGWFVVAWYDGRNGDDDVYIQKFDSAGTPVGANIRVNDDTNGAKQKFPSVAVGGNGVVSVVWTDWRLGNYPANSDIYLQRFDSALVRLEGNRRVNTDGTYASQRDPRIAADRMGNACVVWSDSASLDWNMRGQMIDYSGSFRDANFQVNVDQAGHQLLGDVALDGYDLYFVWVDNRNGHYDIYGRVKRYNYPTLLPQPDWIEASKDVSAADPDPITITIANAGYGELDYQLTAADAWVTLSKDSGATPDSLTVTLSGDGLGYGIHQSRITLIDLASGDSSSIIPVIFTITGPLLDLEPDSLNYKALVEVGAPNNQNIIISNAGTGDLGWSIETTAAWLTVDRASGAADDIVSVGCDISTLVAGSYEAFIVVTDAGALNSPESLKVVFDLQSNIPYLASDPDSISLTLVQGATYSDSLRILNLGGSVASWEAVEAIEWLQADTLSGTENDVIAYTIDATDLSPGYYRDSIIVSDSIAFNDPLIVPVNVILNSFDTVVTTPVNANVGDGFQTQVYLHLINSIRGGTLAFAYDGAYLTIDSIKGPTGDLAGRVTAVIDTVLKVFTVTIAADTVDSLTEPGTIHAADIYGTANDSTGGTTALSASSGAETFVLTGADGSEYPPFLEAGTIDIASPTGIDDEPEGAVPGTFELGQNYPNPFNGTTAIPYVVARSGHVRLEIFNILGQVVRVLVDDESTAGAFMAVWDGRDEWRSDVASGVYLYRLTADRQRAVRRMVLIK